MSQRNSGYERQPDDLYQTPAWVTRALRPHIPLRVGSVWECAAGDGKMSRALEECGFNVYSTDINAEVPLNFLTAFPFGIKETVVDAIITNPPYKLARQFIENALHLTKDQRGVVAMLLRIDFDSAATRKNLFGDNLAWTRKVVLTKRIAWFEEEDAEKRARGEKVSSPSFNHAWYIWDWRNDREPTIAYAPE